MSEENRRRGSRPVRSSGARGRIAEVLAGARATLSEPSRPVTPASLDARIEYIPASSDKSGSSAPYSASSSYLYHGIRVGNPSTTSETSQDVKSDTRKLTRKASGGDSSLLLLDILDTVNLLDTEIQSIGAGGGSLSQALHNMNHSVDKFAKYMKTNEYEENNDLYDRLVGTLCQVLDCTQKKNIRQQACRHIMRLQLIPFPMSVDVLKSTDTVRILLRTTRDLYLCAIEEDGLQEMAGEYDDGYDGPDLICDADEASSMPTAASSDVDDVMVRGGIDLILEFLSVAWVQIRNTMPILLSQTDGSGSIALKIFLEAAVHGAGTLRHYATKETNRKRLSHMGVMKVMSDGIRTAIKVSRSYRQQRAAGDGAATSQSRDESVIFSQLGFVMVQIVGAVRHFSLDVSGKQQMLSSETICHICDLVHFFQSNPELCLNCVRVTAKLSLQDTFRSQLNTKPSYIASITKIILNESDMCLRVMNGDASAVWPSWHTWPLLSRAAYTLGNMTTTKDNNRLLIALGCKCLKPLIVILQTCGCSLMHLFSSSGAAASGGSSDCGGSGSDSGGSRGDGGMDDSSDDDEEEDGDNEAAEQELGEATVRLVRLFANISINSEIGFTLAKRKDSVNMLLELLACSELGKNQDELQLNVVAACTNLTYYSCRLDTLPGGSDGSQSPSLASETIRDLQSMATRLSNYLFHDNPEVVLEAARALGNLTRCDAVVDALCSTRAAEILVMLLNSTDFDILMAVTGALVNVSADSRSLGCLTESEKPAQSLATVLRRSSFKNMQLSVLVCQVFHNLLQHDGDGFSDCAERAVGVTLYELVDCAEDLDDDKYTPFITVGQSVLEYWAPKEKR